jgi:hypothetical protein
LHITLVAFLAWVGLSADGLSSSYYGPEEAFLALFDHPTKNPRGGRGTDVAGLPGHCQTATY